MAKNDILSETLITGAKGTAGGYVDFGIKIDHRSLEIEDAAQVFSVVRHYRPKAILHLAAETDIDRCEQSPAHAYSVNSVGAYHIAMAAREVGAKLIYVSTAGVFDGRKVGPYAEDDRPNPQNYYGHSKYLGELAVAGTVEDHLIIRICWMMGGGPGKDKKFVAKIIKQLNDPAVTEIKAVNDQFGSPTYAKDLINAIKILMREDRRGIFHMSNSGTASRYDVAQSIASTLGYKKKVVPVGMSYFKLDAVRPVNEVLASREKLMRPWQEALRDYLESEW
ncbi:MAG: dTDP-4-dehydrorhamnose reductase [Candidatus Liptonbacteria bacterium]|nr:dTDP-4-dehydrorhamnose reductase [Candidatus Liptonbacteria bacterium]